MSRPRGLRSRRCCRAPRPKPASGRGPIQPRTTISRTFTRRRSGSIDRSPNCRKRSLASIPPCISVLRGPRSGKGLHGSRIIRLTPCLAANATALSPPKKGKGGTDPRPSLKSACFPPQATIPIRRSVAPPCAQGTRATLHPSTIPITLLDRPHTVTLRAILMHGHHPDRSLSVKVIPVQSAQHRCEGMQPGLLSS
jgi:hypothetical protein